MALKIEDVFPNVNTGLGSIGFFFGAGTSKEAGYPLTEDLTKEVLNRLNHEEKYVLKRMFEKENIVYSFEDGTPDIEVISDLIYKYSLSEDLNNNININKSIREHIVKELISINNPNLKNHINFLKSLKALMSNRAESIWIFTTNYDLLFEMAAMEAKIPIHNGFEGALARYFDIERINLKYGKITDTKAFQEYNEPTIKLVKLHGSISWFKRGEQIYETCDYKPLTNEDRSMILPRKQKVMDTLEHPYDKLFRYAAQTIGYQCKYILSCGYSFRDQHINDQLVIPKLREGKTRFMALFEQEPENIEQFKKFKSFNYLTEDKIFIDGNENNETSDLWKFSRFVSTIADKAGVTGDI